MDAEHLKSRIWTEYTSKKFIPLVLLERLHQISGENFEIANRNEPFQQFDAIVDDKLPWRQLRFLGSLESLWVMTYQHGGIGLHYHIVLCKIQNDKLNFFLTGISLVDVDSIYQIKNAFREKKIEAKDTASTYEIDKI